VLTVRAPLRALVLTLLAGVSGAAFADASRAEPWPEAKTPPEARVQSIANEMLLNGKPVRLLRFDTKESAADVLAFYRSAFGAQRVVENRLKDDRVIGTRQGDYFITVQLHALDLQTLQGTVMVSLLTATPSISPVMLDTQRVLPADTKVVSTVQTDDAGKRSLMLVAVNRNSVRANRDHLVAAMAERGFRVTRDDTPPTSPEPTATTLQLAAQNEELSLTVSDAGAYRSVVIHRVREGK
jgi:hypothetical protein